MTADRVAEAAAAAGGDGAPRDGQGGSVGGGAARHPACARARATTACCSCPVTRRSSRRGARGTARRRRTQSWSSPIGTAPDERARALAAGRDRAEFGPEASRATCPRPRRRAFQAGSRRYPAWRSTWTRRTTSRSSAPSSSVAEAAPSTRGALRQLDRAGGPPLAAAGVGLSSFTVSALAPLPPVRPGDDLAGRSPRPPRRLRPGTSSSLPTRWCRRRRGGCVAWARWSRASAPRAGRGAPQGPAPRPGRARRVGRDRPRRGRNAGLRDPPRVRVRERGSGPVECSARGRRGGAAAGAPRASAPRSGRHRARPRSPARRS